MSRLIDADRLKKHYAWWTGNEREMTMDEAKSDFDTIIDLQPTVEAEPKHGRWEHIPLGEGLDYKCSVCGMEMVTPTNYCPNCGARMDEVEE